MKDVMGICGVALLTLVIGLTACDNSQNSSAQKQQQSAAPTQRPVMPDVTPAQPTIEDLERLHPVLVSVTEYGTRLYRYYDEHTKTHVYVTETPESAKFGADQIRNMAEAAKDAQVRQAAAENDAKTKAALKTALELADMLKKWADAE